MRKGEFLFIIFFPFPSSFADYHLPLQLYRAILFNKIQIINKERYNFFYKIFKKIYSKGDTCGNLIFYHFLYDFSLFLFIAAFDVVQKGEVFEFFPFSQYFICLYMCRDESDLP